MGRVKPRFHGYGHGESAGNGWGYEHLSAHRVWGRALKLLPTRVRARGFCVPFMHIDIDYVFGAFEINSKQLPIIPYNKNG
ncbi:hypothetical protein MTR_4g127803 [Medicago truncatula]|uniref:Uncharacterized protein n=1 Tax=Medicago truncatula TaxID=3880 RepID=A0A072USB2_MEDTR|nr:hypothetical protein MTR_4g127803 [Medicago truncatula]